MRRDPYRSPRDQLFDSFSRLDLPATQRAEIIGGSIVVSPTPALAHSALAAELSQALAPPAARHGRCAVNRITLHLPGTDEYVVPDLVTVPEDVLLERPDEWIVDARHAELIAEITSPATAHRDRETKPRSYAHSAVPLYVLIDPLDGDGTAHVHSEPGGDGRYASVVRVPFGKPLPLPEPFGVDLDTSAFVTS